MMSDTGVAAAATETATGAGADFVTGARAEVELTLDVPAEALWELLADPSRAAAFSPETVRAGRPEAPVVGARFSAYNEFPGGATADVVCVVTELERPRVFAWVVLDRAGDPARPGSRWRYELRPGPTPGHTVVRQVFEHGPGDTGVRGPAERDPAVLDERLATLRRNMTTTLTAMAAAAGNGGAA